MGLGSRKSIGKFNANTKGEAEEGAVTRKEEDQMGEEEVERKSNKNSHFKQLHSQMEIRSDSFFVWFLNSITIINSQRNLLFQQRPSDIHWSFLRIISIFWNWVMFDSSSLVYVYCLSKLFHLVECEINF